MNSSFCADFSRLQKREPLRTTVTTQDENSIWQKLEEDAGLKIVHEINNPLSIMRCQLESIVRAMTRERSEVSSGLQNSIHSMNSQIERISKVIQSET